MKVPLLYSNGHHQPSHKQPVVVLEVRLRRLLRGENTERREEDKREESGDRYRDNLCQPKDGDDGNTVSCLGCLQEVWIVCTDNSNQHYIAKIA